MNIQNLLREKAAQYVNELYKVEIIPSDIQLQQTRPEFEGDYTVVVFPLTKVSRKSPQETAEELGEALVKNVEQIEKYEIVKGFLNILFTKQTWLDYLRELGQSETVNWVGADKPRKIMVEYSSPNTNKPLHLGHVRNNLLGYSVAEILKARGHQVIKTSLVNDRGIHICKSMIAWIRFGNGETPESSGIKGDHLVGKYYVEFDKAYKAEIEGLKASGMLEEEAKKEAPLMKEAQELLRKWEDGDAETIRIWKMMNEWVYAGFDVTYKKLGVDFDSFYYESQTYLLGKNIVQQGLGIGVFKQKEDGSVWIDLTGDGLDEKLVLRSDGTSVYITQDLGTAQQRFDEFSLDELIYTVGNEQDYHFKVLRLIFKHFGVSWWDSLNHLSYGMVDLPSGKMKSREGTVVDADELIDDMIRAAEEKTREQGKIETLSPEEQTDLFRKIGLSALKFFLLKVDPKKRMLFNPEESIELQGFTGPFVQYSYTRIRSILRKAGENGNIVFGDIDLHPEEKELIKLISRKDDILREAEQNLSPAVIANYSYELAKEFNRFYQEHSVLNEENSDVRNFRILLATKTAQCIEASMKLLGIEMPERM